MKKNHFFPLLFLLPLLGLSVSLQAQQNFEAGALAVASAYHGASVSAPSATGSIGFAPGAAGGLFVGQTMTNRLGGELRYIFAHNDLKVSSGGKDTEFAGHSHTFHYDLLFYFAKRDAKIRPYVAGGGGLKVYQGTGTEQPFQPLSNIALLTKTSQTMGVVDYGAGVKWQFNKNMMFRVEFRDYVTEVPKVFEPGVGANFSGLMHQWMPAFGVSWTF
jgi:opacity protein-like surface antigen